MNISDINMNITNISNAKSLNFDFPKFAPTELKQKDAVNFNQQILDKNEVKFDNNSPSKSTNWQHEILLQGLEILENKIQMSNNSILLDKPENQPIESFDEAIRELKLINKDVLFATGSQAQANISHQVVFELLTEM